MNIWSRLQHVYLVEAVINTELDVAAPKKLLELDRELIFRSVQTNCDIEIASKRTLKRLLLRSLSK